ncbi:MAG: glutamate mutase L, partial [Chloroflexi bacterium]|nr:glutamate mutase L [Chloroflexota bacterium]
AKVVEEYFDYRVVDNVRPSVHTESLAELQRELSAAYVQLKLASLPGYRKLREWCAAPIASTLEALGTTWRFIARRNNLSQGVLGVDVGGATTCIGAAYGDSYQWTVGANLGTGFGIRESLRLSGVSNMHRWLVAPLEEQDTWSHLENLALRPHGIPQTMDDLLMTHAVIRQAILLTMRRMRRHHWHRLDTEPEKITTPAFDLIAARGGALTNTPQDGLIVLSLLDALQPTGLSRLVLDWASLWPQLGIIARVSPLAASQVLERDSFRELGTIIAPIGEARDGEHALNIIIRREDGQTLGGDIPAGEIRRFPLALHEHAEIEVRPSRAFDIGLGRKGYGGRARVRGGTLGIIVDTRGRPLSLPQTPSLRREHLRRWLSSLIEDAQET